jgi:hypothetical protein
MASLFGPVLDRARNPLGSFRQIYNGWQFHARLSASWICFRRVIETRGITRQLVDIWPLPSQARLPTDGERRLLAAPYYTTLSSQIAAENSCSILDASFNEPSCTRSNALRSGILHGILRHENVSTGVSAFSRGCSEVTFPFPTERCYRCRRPPAALSAVSMKV